MNKKDLPVALLQSLNRLNNQLLSLSERFDHLVEQDFNSNKLIRFKDIDVQSDFRFEIKSISITNGSPKFLIETTPSSSISNKVSTTTQNEKGVIILFKKWVEWLDVYDKSHLTPEDAILKGYENDFYSEFEILDEDAAKTPFSLKQQLFLDDYLRSSQKKLELLKEGKTKKEKVEIDRLLKEAESIKQALTQESKKKIVRRLSKFWSNARKVSVQIIREIFVKAMAEIGKGILLGK